jgi:hypothetical protein
MVKFNKVSMKILLITIFFMSYGLQSPVISGYLLSNPSIQVSDFIKEGNTKESVESLELGYLYCPCEDLAKMPSRDNEKRGNPNLNNILLGYVWEGDALNLVGYSNKSNDSKLDDYDMNLKLFFRRFDQPLYQLDKNYFLGSYILTNRVLNNIKGLCGVRSPKTNKDYAYINLMPVPVKGAEGSPSYIQWKIFISSSLPIDPRNADRRNAPMQELYLGEEVDGGLLDPIPPGGGRLR